MSIDLRALAGCRDQLFDRLEVAALAVHQAQAQHTLLSVVRLSQFLTQQLDVRLTHRNATTIVKVCAPSTKHQQMVHSIVGASEQQLLEDDNPLARAHGARLVEEAQADVQRARDELLACCQELYDLERKRRQQHLPQLLSFSTVASPSRSCDRYLPLIRVVFERLRVTLAHDHARGTPTLALSLSLSHSVQTII